MLDETKLYHEEVAFGQNVMVEDHNGNMVQGGVETFVIFQDTDNGKANAYLHVLYNDGEYVYDTFLKSDEDVELDKAYSFAGPRPDVNFIKVTQEEYNILEDYIVENTEMYEKED